MLKTNTKNLINWLGGITAVFLVTFLCFYQLFVDSQYQRLPLKQFFTLTTLTSAWQQLTRHDVLPPTVDNTDKTLTITVDCQPTCYFSVFDLTGTLIATVPAIKDTDASAILTDLEIKFFDPQHQLIGYQTVSIDHPTFYVINFVPDLLQTIQLNLSDITTFDFVDYYSATQQIKFHSVNHQTGITADYFYSAVKPELIKL